MKQQIQKDSSPLLYMMTPRSFASQREACASLELEQVFTAARHGAPIYHKPAQTRENIMTES